MGDSGFSERVGQGPSDMEVPALGQGSCTGGQPWDEVTQEAGPASPTFHGPGSWSTERLCGPLQVAQHVGDAIT